MLDMSRAKLAPHWTTWCSSSSCRIKRIAYVNGNRRVEYPTFAYLSESRTSFPRDCCRQSCDSVVVVEKFSPEYYPMCPIDISVYRMRQPLDVYRDHLFEDFVWHPVDPLAVLTLRFLLAFFVSLRVESSSHQTIQELWFCLRNDSNCGNKLRTMYWTRSELSRPGVFLLVTNLLVSIFKARSHGSFSTSPMKSFQH